MSTLILRLGSVGEGLRGTVEVPGGEPRTFHTADDLVEILYELTARSVPPDTPGNGPGSTSSSAIRDT